MLVSSSDPCGSRQKRHDLEELLSDVGDFVDISWWGEVKIARLRGCMKLEHSSVQ